MRRGHIILKPALNHVMVYKYRNRKRQIVDVMLKNAIKYSLKLICFISKLLVE